MTRRSSTCISQIEDGADLAAWYVTLLLPRPTGYTWNLDRTTILKRLTRQRVDEVAEKQDRVLAGLTLVKVSLKDAPDSERVLDDDIESEGRYHAFTDEAAAE